MTRLCSRGRRRLVQVCLAAGEVKHQLCCRHNDGLLSGLGCSVVGLAAPEAGAARTLEVVEPPPSEPPCRTRTLGAFGRCRGHLPILLVPLLTGLSFSTSPPPPCSWLQVANNFPSRLGNLRWTGLPIYVHLWSGPPWIRKVRQQQELLHFLSTIAIPATASLALAVLA
jgi:hypothetical protein